VKRLSISFFVAVFLVSVSVAVFITNYIDIDRSGKIVEGHEGEKPVVTFGFSPPSGLKDWQEKNLARANTRYLLSEDGGKLCVEASGESSASALLYRRRMTDLEDPYVSWEWKAVKFPSRASPEDENLCEKANFDFAAQLYVIFHARFFMDTRAIQYVWTESLPAGTVSRSPYTKNVMIMVLESGASGEWKSEKRDIRKDYKELFGEELDADIEGIAFMTDSDSTRSSSAAYYANIEIGSLEKEEGGATRGERPIFNEVLDDVIQGIDSLKSSIIKLWE